MRNQRAMAGKGLFLFMILFLWWMVGAPLSRSAVIPDAYRQGRAVARPSAPVFDTASKIKASVKKGMSPGESFFSAGALKPVLNSAQREIAAEFRIDLGRDAEVRVYEDGSYSVICGETIFKSDDRGYIHFSAGVAMVIHFSGEEPMRPVSLKLITGNSAEDKVISLIRLRKGEASPPDVYKISDIRVGIGHEMVFRFDLDQSTMKSETGDNGTLVVLQDSQRRALRFDIIRGITAWDIYNIWTGLDVGAYLWAQYRKGTLIRVTHKGEKGWYAVLPKGPLDVTMAQLLSIKKRTTKNFCNLLHDDTMILLKHPAAQASLG